MPACKVIPLLFWRVACACEAPWTAILVWALTNMRGAAVKSPRINHNFGRCCPMSFAIRYRGVKRVGYLGDAS